MAHKGKRYKKSLELYDRDKFYVPGEALDIAKALASAKFDESVELSLRLGVDPRKADQQVRGSVSLPKGTGKSVRVAVFAQGEKAREAEEAGAEVVGAQDLADRIQKGWTDFDVAIASPDMMPVVGKLGKILGPRGLMPNPKTGTVTTDVAKAVSDIQGGKINFRVDKQANLHLVIGKTSFDEAKLVENYAAALDEVLRAKPSTAKGRYLKKVAMSTTMGPGIQVDPTKTRALTDEGGAISRLSLSRAAYRSPRNGETRSDMSFHAAQQSVDGWINPKAFVVPALGTLGNVPRNFVQAPGMIQLDMSVSRTFRIAEGKSIQLRGESFNLPNHLNPALPIAAVNQGTFGKIQSDVSGTSGLSSGDPRIIQFALKYLF